MNNNRLSFLQLTLPCLHSLQNVKRGAEVSLLSHLNIMARFNDKLQQKREKKKLQLSTIRHKDGAELTPGRINSEHLGKFDQCVGNS